MEGVMKVLAENIERSKRVILRAIPKIAAKDWTEVLRQNQVSQIASSSSSLLLIV